MSAALPLADRFQALADPTRLRIVALLRLMELSVGELAQVLGQSQPRVSRHLKILADVGVLERRGRVAEGVPDAGAGRPVSPYSRDRQLGRRGNAGLVRLRYRTAEIVDPASAPGGQPLFTAMPTFESARSTSPRARSSALTALGIARSAGWSTSAGTGRMIELCSDRGHYIVRIDRSSKCCGSRASTGSRGIHRAFARATCIPPLGDQSADSIIIHWCSIMPIRRGGCRAARVCPGGRFLSSISPRGAELRATDAHIRLGFEDDVIVETGSCGGA